jgi:hypothetical protein
MSKGERTLETDEIAHCSEHLVELVAVKGFVTIWRLRQRGRPDIHVEQSVDDRGRIILENLHHGWTELSATPGTDNLDHVFDLTRAQVNLDDVCHVDDVDLDRNIFSSRITAPKRRYPASCSTRSVRHGPTATEWLNTTSTI